MITKWSSDERVEPSRIKIEIDEVKKDSEKSQQQQQVGPDNQ